ncbi:Gfo/Idh/MocA family oxidoreductase [Mesorhizobium sp. YC-39]|uniref:Gfo/Idh/MocA family protein n=1 Tax=unclassified Mesorhizobium TaxID=325217 RepID=UPI0021E83749|nr:MULTISPECIES: Gfo/Idh/MocA family oxidoreductase [unclassified Mesorhizobium]MCV3207187.1 Gfo/Idh/MocA family oxidoreductase [Mesorhizobium sp. YC-2]MCV3228914.1 Gfo/Idh/MocA family oxidoreductase [Mesorhizobium sp. YC-39]
MASELRWGVLGTADIARSQVVPAIQASTNGRVVAVAGRDPRRTADFAATLGIDRTFETYAGLIASPDVDAVYIPLPNSLHAEWSLAAADAGKPVLCEKPLALTAKDARRVADRFAAKSLPLMEGFMYRFHPQNVRALELVASGAIGTVREVRAHLSVDIMQAAASGNVRFDKALGGGSLLDMGCYAVNVVRRIFGEEPVAAMGVLDLDKKSGVDLAATALLLFSDGRSASVSSSFKANGQGTYQIIGTRGTIEVPRAFLPGMGSRAAEGLIIVVDADGHRVETRFEPVDQYRLMAEAFAGAVLSGRPVPYPPRDAVDNLRVLDAIAASAGSGMRTEIKA